MNEKGGTDRPPDFLEAQTSISTQQAQQNRESNFCRGMTSDKLYGGATEPENQFT